MNALERWEKVEAARGTDKICAATLEWAARYADSVYESSLRRASRIRIDELIEKGATAGRLLEKASEEADRFSGVVASDEKAFRAVMTRGIEFLREEIETYVFEAVIDTRRHVWLDEIFLRSLDPEVVEKRREEIYGNRVEKLFLAELDRLKGL